jgi:hypothetical protein
MSRLIVTEGATYEQRTAGTSNAGGTLTEVRPGVDYIEETDFEGHWEPSGPWSLLDPAQAEPYVGDRWLLRHAHGKYVLTDIVNEIIGDL